MPPASANATAGYLAARATLTSNGYSTARLPDTTIPLTSNPRLSGRFRSDVPDPGVPQHADVDQEAQRAQLVLLPFAVALAELAFWPWKTLRARVWRASCRFFWVPTRCLSSSSSK
jgi:hypothetical protein